MKKVIIKPVITEKSMNDAAKGVYTFVVDTAATKDTIKIAVEAMYSVHVIRVATHTIKGTKTRFTRLGKNVSNLAYKKARVVLRNGEKIGIFEEILTEATKQASSK